MITMAEPRRTPAAPNAAQPEQALSSMKAHRLFPNRTSLYVHEVANALEISVQQTISLINEGLLIAIEITGRGNKTSREHWRIPVGEFDAYVQRRRSDRKAQ